MPCPGCGYTGIHGDECWDIKDTARKCPWLKAYLDKAQWNQVSPYNDKISREYADANWRNFVKKDEEKVRALEV